MKGQEQGNPGENDLLEAESPMSPVLNPEETNTEKEAEGSQKKGQLRKTANAYYKRRTSGSPCSSNNSTASENVEAIEDGKSQIAKKLDKKKMKKIFSKNTAKFLKKN